MTPREEKWLQGIVYVLLCASMFFSGYYLRKHTADAYQVPPQAVVMSDTLVTLNDPQRVAYMLKRYDQSAAMSRQRWEQKQGKTLTKEQAAAYMFLLMAAAHPCPLEDKFLTKETDTVLEAALQLKVVQ